MKISDTDYYKIIEGNLYLTMSTCDLNGNPWISNAFFCLLPNDSLCWYSSWESKHSLMLSKNNKCAICIFNSTALGDDVKALYLQGEVYEARSVTDISKCIKAYGMKMWKRKFIKLSELKQFILDIKDFKCKSPLRFYIFKPIKIWKLAPSLNYNGKYVDSRVELL